MDDIRCVCRFLNALVVVDIIDDCNYIVAPALSGGFRLKPIDEHEHELEEQVFFQVRNRTTTH